MQKGVGIVSGSGWLGLVLHGTARQRKGLPSAAFVCEFPCLAFSTGKTGASRCVSTALRRGSLTLAYLRCALWAGLLQEGAVRVAWLWIGGVG